MLSPDIMMMMAAGLCCPEDDVGIVIVTKKVLIIHINIDPSLVICTNQAIDKTT